jgi:RES domain-containing protein
VRKAGRFARFEVLANADDLADDYVTTRIEIPDGIEVTVIFIADLPPGWDEGEATNATRDIGTNWAKGLTTVVLSVPSVVIPRERNYILNPAHPDFARIRFHEPESFYFDDRLRRMK